MAARAGGEAQEVTRQNGCPAGSAKTRHVHWPWSSRRAPSSSTRASPSPGSGVLQQVLVQEGIALSRADRTRLFESIVAELLAYLLSPPASLITGASITIDGGWTAH